MKIIIQLILILIIWESQSNICIAQDYQKHYLPPTPKEMDSLIKVGLKMQENYIREHNLHKDNKDSAWINDFDGHCVWDSRSKSKEGKTLNIIDSITNNHYILDSTHIIVTAYNKSNQIIWKTDPHKDNFIPEYRHKNPTITYFKIGKLNRKLNDIYNKDERVIFIRFSNSQFGFLELLTGKFIFEGQD